MLILHFLSEQSTNPYLTGGKENILVTQKKYYLLVNNWQKNLFDHIKAFDNKIWVDQFKIEETEIYRQWKKSLKFLIVDISQLWNLRRRRRQKNRRHCH